MALTATTLSGAVTASQSKIVVTSATGFAVGYECRIDDERTRVQAISGTQITVRRGLSGGSVAAAHADLSRVVVGPQSDFSVIPAPRTYTYDASGAITMAPGLHKIVKATAAAMTLADPTADLEGIELVIISASAAAHTVTYTAGFNANTTSSDVGTFAATKGNGIIIRCVNGLWHIVANNGVTLA